MLLKIIGFLIVGRIVIFLLQRFPFENTVFFGKFFQDGKFLRKLLDCDLCIGFWVYLALSFIIQLDLVREMFGNVGWIIINQVITGMIATFVVHVFKVGFMSEFGTVFVE